MIRFCRDREGFGQFLLQMLDPETRPDKLILETLKSLKMELDYNAIPLINFVEYAGALQEHIVSLVKASCGVEKTSEIRRIGDLTLFCVAPKQEILEKFPEYHFIFRTFIGSILRHLIFCFADQKNRPIGLCPRCKKFFIKDHASKKYCNNRCAEAYKSRRFRLRHKNINKENK